MTSTFGRLGQWSPIISQFISVVSSANNWIPDARIDRVSIRLYRYFLLSRGRCWPINWTESAPYPPSSFSFCLLSVGCPFESPASINRVISCRYRFNCQRQRYRERIDTRPDEVCSSAGSSILSATTSFRQGTTLKGTSTGWCSFEFQQSRFV